jgi:hypothetical protein
VQTIDLSSAPPEEVPAEVVGEAKAAFNQRIVGEMAILVWDSMLDDGAPSWHHHLRFEHPRLWIEVSVSVLPECSSLHGVMHPAVPLHVELESEGSDVRLVAEVTRHALRIESVPHGLVRLHLLDGQGIPGVQTEWFLV